MLSKRELPEHEHDLFIVDGDHCVKIFKGYGAWNGGLIQTVNIEPGTYKLSLYVYSDAVLEYKDGRKVPADDPLSCRIRVIINDRAFTWINLPALAGYNIEEEFDASDGATEVRVEFMMPFALANSGVFLDAVRLERVEPDKCPGDPREQYDRTYVLMHPSVSAEWVHAAVRGSWDKYKFTIGNSADDAGIGNLDHKSVIAVNPQMWTDDIRAFFERYYPGVAYKSITAASPRELERKISDLEFDPEIAPRKFTLVTAHQQTRVEAVLEFLESRARAGRPVRWYKIVHTDAEFSREIKAVSPDTKVVFRYVDNDFGRYHSNTDTDAAVNEFLGHFWDAIENNPIDAVESLNETFGTHDYGNVMNTVRFDVAFCEEVHRRSGGSVAPIILTAPPGNPDHGVEEEWLVPAVEAAIDFGGLLGPHTYWPGNPDRDTVVNWLETEGYHFHLRPLLSWDVTFKRFGLAPRYFFGETGPVAVSVREDGRPGGFLNSGAGWRSPDCLGGNLDLLIELILMYEDMLAKWNKDNGNRCEGYAFFTTHRGDWQYFHFNDTEWSRLMVAMESRA